MSGSRIEIQSIKKQGFLLQLVQIAIGGGIPLGQAILNAQASVFSPTFQKGRIVVHQSGSGQSGSFQVMQGAEWTQDNIFGMLQEFWNLLTNLINNSFSGGVYTFASTVNLPGGITIAANTPLPVDDGSAQATWSYYVAMVTDDNLNPPTQQTVDVTGLNNASFGGVPNAG